MKKLILILVAIFAFSNIHAEQKIISGKILLNNKYTLGNIVVTAKKSKATVSSNNNGEFSIACEENDVLLFKATPFRTVRKSVKGKFFLNINMTFRKNIIDKDQMVDLGFIQVKDIDAAMKSAPKSMDDYANYTNVYDLISRKFPHVTFEGTNIIVRGKNSMQGSNAALLVINGTIVNDISHIQPVEIKSINLLKGPSATIYGSRGANGVVVIRTK
jgi:TonB-dependent SusC/RagA subfamily outer membrane receptor